MPSIAALALRDDPAVWARLGFNIDADHARVGDVTFAFASAVVGWQLGGHSTEVDGISAVNVAAAPSPVEHANGLVAVDHVVVATPDWQRTVDDVAAAGFVPRSTSVFQPPGRPPRRQAFFRVDGGARFLEVIGPEPGGEDGGPVSLWGVTFTTADMDTTARAMDGLLSRPRPAVQRGRAIAVVDRAAGTSLAIAVMTPRPERWSETPSKRASGSDGEIRPGR